MGKLTAFNLLDFGCTRYVETGVALCESFRYAVETFGEQNCHGVDLDPDFIRNARQSFPKSDFFLGTSVEAFKHWLSGDSLKHADRVLFFLDAHFPGADYHGAPYDPSAPNALPMREELELIRRYRPDNHDVILCDDARIYYEAPFANGNIPFKADHGIEDIFPNRSYSIDLRDEGYIIIKPSV